MRPHSSSAQILPSNPPAVVNEAATGVVRGTIHSIQFLRFVAATLVVIYHVYIGYVIQLPVGAPAQSGYWLRFGAVGVHVFFVISGYIMYLTNFARPTPFRSRHFLLRRLIRVYPTYWLFVLLYLAAEAVLGIVPVLSLGQFAGMIALTPADSSRVIGPAWTLSFEIYFYIIFGLVMTLGTRRGVITLTALFLTSIGVGVIIHPASAVAHLVTNSLLLEFLAGVWVARLTARAAWPRLLGWLTLGGGFVGFAAGLTWGYERLPSAISWGAPSALLVAGAIILEQTSAAGRTGIVQRLSWLGDSSYSLYLCHTLVITVLVAAFRAAGWMVPLLPLIVLTTLACVALAALFYQRLELPMISTLHGLTAAKRSTGLDV